MIWEVVEPEEMGPDWEKRVTGAGLTPLPARSLLLDSRCSVPSAWSSPQTHVSLNLEAKLLLPFLGCALSVLQSQPQNEWRT